VVPPLPPRAENTPLHMQYRRVTKQLEREGYHINHKEITLKRLHSSIGYVPPEDFE